MALPLCSSKLIIRILEHDGFHAAKTSKAGSHRTYRKFLPAENRTLTTVVVLNQREVPRWTLKDILINAEMDDARFLRLHKKCR